MMMGLFRALWFYVRDASYHHRAGLIGSFLLHGMVVILFVGILPYTKPNLSTPETFLDVEIIDDDTVETRTQDIAKKAKKIQKARAKPPAPPKPAPSAAVPSPAKPVVTQEVDEDTVLLHQKKAPKITPKAPQQSPKRPPNKETIKPKKESVTAKVNNAPKAVRAPKKINTASLLKNLEDIAASQLSDGKRLENTASKAIEEASQHQDKNLQIAEKDTMSLDELQRLKRQIISCWSIPAGARDIKDFTADIHIFLTPNGKVIKTSIIPNPQFRGNEFYRVFLSSAERALYDPKCTPLELPKGKYNLWKEIIFTFNARDL